MAAGFARLQIGHHHQRAHGQCAMRGRHRAVIENLPVGRAAAFVGRGVPRRISSLAQNRPVRRHKVEIVVADSSGRNGVTGMSRGAVVDLAAQHATAAPVAAAPAAEPFAPDFPCAGNRSRPADAIASATPSAAPTSASRRLCSYLGVRLRSRARLPVGVTRLAGWLAIGLIGRSLVCLSKRSARLRSVSAAVRMAIIDSLRTCGITASFTYAIAWRSSISISSIASSMRWPTPGPPHPGGEFALIVGNPPSSSTSIAFSKSGLSPIPRQRPEQERVTIKIPVDDGLSVSDDGLTGPPLNPPLECGGLSGRGA